MRLPGTSTIQLQGETCLQLPREDGPCEEGLNANGITYLN